MIDYERFNPVITLTTKGKILVAGVRLLYRMRKIFGFTQWKAPVPGHHENPIKTNSVDQVYLGYKYYFKALVKAETGSGLEKYFAEQELKIEIPEDFRPEAAITLAAGGDLIPYSAVRRETCENLWNEAGDFFFNNDIVFANLETVADFSRPYSAAPEVMLHDMFFNINQQTFEIFSGNGKYRGYDVLSTANNHTMDQGVAGILATNAFLNVKKIAYAGTASSKEAVDEFPLIERDGIKIAFLAYTYSLNKESLPKNQPWLCNLLNLNEKDPDISLIVHQANIARQRGADIIVAALHMGCAYQAYPSLHIVNNMHLICEQTGVDILLGGHPHNPQPLEIYKSNFSGKEKSHFIVYSLGDFIAYDIYKWCHLPLVLRMHIAKGRTGQQETTLVTKLEVKPFYMHMDKQGNLELKDFLKLLNNPDLQEKNAVKEVKELADFFDRFVITEKQKHLLV